jgi:hypothetical protein
MPISHCKVLRDTGFVAVSAFKTKAQRAASRTIKSPASRGAWTVSTHFVVPVRYKSTTTTTATSGVPLQQHVSSHMSPQWYNHFMQRLELRRKFQNAFSNSSYQQFYNDCLDCLYSDDTWSAGRTLKTGSKLRPQYAPFLNLQQRHLQP